MAESYQVVLFFQTKQRACYRVNYSKGVNYLRERKEKITTHAMFRKRQETNSDHSFPSYKYMHVMLVSISYHPTTTIILSFTSCIAKEHGQDKS
jgi:hypothetical protein